MLVFPVLLLKKEKFAGDSAPSRGERGEPNARGENSETIFNINLSRFLTS